VCAPGIAVICFIAWRADLLGAEEKRSYANNISHAHHAIGMAGSPARADMISFRIYGQQADPVIVLL
jgi:hypothetical protein